MTSPVTSVYCYANLGTAFGCGDFVSSLRVDEVVSYNATLEATLPSVAYTWNVPQTVSGGRHTLWQINDPDNLIAESNEGNNAYARQWVWQPQILALETQQLRARPPQPYAGTEHLPVGVPQYPNFDGMRIPPANNYWRGMALSNPDPGYDYDLYLYSPSTGVDNGFDFGYLAARRPAAPTPKSWSPTATPWATRPTTWARSTGTARRPTTGWSTGSRTSVLQVGGEFARGVAENQMLRMEEFIIFGGQEGLYSLELKNVTAGQPVTVVVFDQSFTEGSIYAAPYSATTGPDGRAVVNFNAAVAGYYGVAIVRHAFQGTAPFTYNLKLWPSTPDLAAVTLPGSHAPLIPRNAFDIPIGNPVPAPTQLDGDVLNTVMYFHMANLGPVETQPFNLGFLFDGVTAADRLLAVRKPAGRPGDHP